MPAAAQFEHYSWSPYRFYGLGDIAPQQINAIVTTGASTTVGILAALGVVGGPVGAAVGGLIAVGSLVANLFHGCGVTCTAATNIANKLEPVMAQNLQHYMSAPVHYRSLQQAALNNFDTAWRALQQACSDPSLAQAGQRCISDRQPGACVWKNDGKGGAAGSGNVCWNWFVGYRDPIANDPNVVDDPIAVDVSQLSSGSPSSNTNLAPLLVVAALIILAVML